MDRRLTQQLGALFYRAAIVLAAIIVSCSSIGSGAVFAADSSSTSPSLYDFYSQNGVLFYSANTTGCNNNGGGSSGAASVVDSSDGSAPSAGTTFTLDQVKSFAVSSIASTFGVSDQAAESYFLKSDSIRANHFGLTADNIGAISAAVKSIGVSPTFFWLYSVEEGSGAGGFINHYASDTDGGALANAQRDAQYLVTASKAASSGVATGGGEPGDMPTAEATSFLSSMPAGSIGIVYVQATAAVTAEIETLSGKTGDWTGKFNSPLSGIMGIIVTLGGNPLSSGAGSACGSLGSGMQAGIKWAEMIANNSGYGYDQGGRTTGYPKWQSDPNCTTACGSFDCSSFISAILTVAGFFQEDPNFTTTGEADALQKVGFTNVTSQINLSTGDGLQAGDILLNTLEHTEMYIGNGQNIGAHKDIDGKVGESEGQEINTEPYYNFPWDSVWRAPSK